MWGWAVAAGRTAGRASSRGGDQHFPFRSCASTLSAGSDSPRSAPASPRPGWDLGGSQRDVSYLLGPCPREPWLRASVFHHALFTLWETFPRSSCLLCRFFSRSPNRHKNDGCALCFPGLFFSTWSRRPVPKLLAWAPPALARGSLRCLGMLQLGAADGNAVLKGSDDALGADELFAPAPKPKSCLLVLRGDAALGASTHPYLRAWGPSP